MTVTLVTKIPGGEGLSFRSYSGLLRHLAATIPQAGRVRSPAEFFLGGRYRSGEPLGHSVHVINRGLGAWQVSSEQLATLLELQARYKRYLHHVAEVLPDWRDVGETPYMDNSVEMTQVNRWGGTRTVMTTPPSGDLC